MMNPATSITIEANLIAAALSRSTKLRDEDKK